MPRVRTPSKPRSGITFAVDAVEPATERLPECRAHEAVRERLGSIESCSDYHATVVKDFYGHALLAAVHKAFAEHRPLTLTPDAVWITIAQGVAHHMTVHAERLRDRFVTHKGRAKLTFKCLDWAEGSPENPWQEAFDSWAGQIRDHVGPTVHDALVCDFSTTGSHDRAASQVVMMDVFERYFHYEAVCICGIPEVTLEGTTADWQRLADKVEELAVFDLGWWLKHLRPICRQFARASQGEVDLKHWQSICKLREEYGGDIINGWVAKLFPYLQSFIGGPCNRRNPIFESGRGFQSLVAPSGLSRVPFTWSDLMTGRTRAMEAVAGLFGFAQDADTLALKPVVGWAVREGSALEVAIGRVCEEHATFPVVDWKQPDYLPEDLCEFYHRTDGAELFGTGDAARVRLLPVASHTPLEWGELPEKYGNSRGPDGRVWHRFAVFPDGSWLALNLDRNARDPRPKPEGARWRYEPNFHAVCHTSAATRNKPGLNPVVAVSFTELLTRLLESEGQPYWLAPDFKPYGDAELFTRRN